MNPIVIGVVGPCAAGKTTLIKSLKQNGYQAKHIAQEHSYVADMWRKLTNPGVLIYLDVSYPLTLNRRNINWSFVEYQRQVDRLLHAREHADFYLHTDELSPQEVLLRVISFLEAAK